MIGAAGTSTDDNIIRIGTAQTSTYLAGNIVPVTNYNLLTGTATNGSIGYTYSGTQSNSLSTLNAETTYGTLAIDLSGVYYISAMASVVASGPCSFHSTLVDASNVVLNKQYASPASSTTITTTNSCISIFTAANTIRLLITPLVSDVMTASSDYWKFTATKIA
jgi:hypothetical protein